MSLQAKIEAVIYASEEPVTLPQLMGLLGVEAQAELDALKAQQATLALTLEGDGFGEEAAGEASGDQDALNAEVLEDAELEREGDEVSAPVETLATEEADSLAALQSDNQAGESSPEGEASGEHVAAADTVMTDAEPGAPASADDKKQAREKERRLREHFRLLLERLIAEYANSDRGLEIREVAGGFRMATKPEYHDAVRGFIKQLKPPLKLSLQALETLAVIAYKQPVTAPEISEIRSVESAGVLGTLMARKLIGTAGRKAVIGRPMLYKTTKEFLLRFGLKDINELPSIEEFEKMAAELGNDAMGAVQEEIPMSQEAAGTARESVEMVSGDGSPVLDELNAPPARSQVAEDADEAAGSRGAEHSGTAGAQTEPGSGPSSGVSEEAAAAVSRNVEPMRDVHEAQADGVPDSADEAAGVDQHEPYSGNDETGA